MRDGIRNIFMPHIHEDDDALGKLKALLGKRGMEVRDGSINADKPNQATSADYIKSEILAPRIRWASVLVVIVSPRTRKSPWVDWEIEYAHKQGKRIVGVWVHGAQGTDVPESLHKYADAIVGWSGEKVSDAITGAINDWTKPSGEPWPARAIPRHRC